MPRGANPNQSRLLRPSATSAALSRCCSRLRSPAQHSQFNSATGRFIMRAKFILASLALLFAATALALQTQEYKSGIIWPEPPVIDPGPPGGVPSDAIVLFDGKSLDAWEGGDKWKIDDGVATAAGGTITSKQKFADCQLHVEFATPEEVKG